MRTLKLMPMQNPFSLDTVRIPITRIIDRERQIAYLREHAIVNSANVLVTGEFGIGKTCLLRKFRAGLQNEFGEKVLLIEMEMRRLSQDTSEFLGDVLLKLIGVFWERILKRPYSQLIRAVTSPADVREQLLPQVRQVLELYRMLRPECITADLEEHNVIGVTGIVKASKDEKLIRHVVQSPLSPSEFVSLADEILVALEEHGVERTIIFGDEANHIDPEIEIDLLRRHFEAFAQRNVQFVLTAKAEVLEQIPRLKDAFPARVDIAPFEEPTALDEILQVYTAGAAVPAFSLRAREVIWRISHGKPREIQRICQACVEHVQSAAALSTGEVDVETVLQSVATVYELIPR